MNESWTLPEPTGRRSARSPGRSRSRRAPRRRGASCSRCPSGFTPSPSIGELDLYTPGKARDHGYRLASIPDSFAGLSVLDVGTFDGFYSFLAEARGARRVLAIDNEQYVEWVRDRWGVRLSGGEGFREIHRLRDSRVEYRCLDAYALDALEERFDLIFCFGLLHRVEGPALATAPAHKPSQ